MTSAPTSATKADATKPTEYTVIVATRTRGDAKEFLMVRHQERGWELPGGKFLLNEGPVHCALREFREETGHLLGQPHFVVKMKKENGVCFVFTGILGTKVEEPDDDEAVKEMSWFAKLPRGDGLAFPDDPYDEMGKRLGIQFG